MLPHARARSPDGATALPEQLPASQIGSSGAGAEPESIAREISAPIEEAFGVVRTRFRRRRSPGRGGGLPRSPRSVPASFFREAERAHEERYERTRCRALQ